MTWKVIVPKTRDPKFPPICIGCGAAPTSSVKIQQPAVGWWSVFQFGWLYGIATGRTVDVPACASCVPTLKRARWTRQAFQSAFVLAGCVAGFWLFREWSGYAQRFAILGVALLVFLPYYIWEELHPPAVDITVTDGNVTFRFADQAYADQFATENGVV